MRAHDAAGAAEPLERLEAQSVRPGLPFLVPDVQEHELEVRRLDAGRAVAVAGGDAVVAE